MLYCRKRARGGVDLNQNDECKYPAYITIVRGAIIFMFFLIIKMISVMTCAFANGKSGFDMSIQLLPCLISLPLIFNSIQYMATVYNRRERVLFLRTKPDKPTLKNELLRIFKTRDFWIEYATLSTLVVISSLLGGFFEFSMIIIPKYKDVFLFKCVLPIPIVLLLFFVISLHRRYDARLYWYQLESRGEISRLDNTFLLIPRILAIAFGYPLLFPSALYALLGIFSVVNILVALVNVMTLLGFALAVAGIALAVMLILALNALVLRRRLIKKLKLVAKSSEYKLSEIKRPYASLFKVIPECNFTLEYQGRVFSCRLIGSWWQRAPLHFISKKHALYLHRVGTRTHHFTYECHFDYAFEGEGDKLLVVCPMPRWLFASVENTDKIVTPEDLSGLIPGTNRNHRQAYLGGKSSEYSRALEAGDKIWGYAVYNTTSFISAIDRKCLGRYNGMFE